MSDFSRRSLIGMAGLGVGASVHALSSRPTPSAQRSINVVDLPSRDHHHILQAEDFGAIGDGKADDTDALIDLFRAMQTEGKPGLLGGSGDETRYLVRGGEWKWTFSNTPTASPPGPPGPTLFTSGKVVIVAKPGSPESPLLSIHNDPQRGHRFVHGGFVGGMWFEDGEGDDVKRHGISLQGVEFMHFGPMFSSSLKGDLIYIQPRGDALTADAWHVLGCFFEGAGTWNTDGWTFNNDSVSQVFNFNHIVFLWNIAGGKGIFRGPGSNNTIDGISCYQSRGWALDLVPDIGTTQGLFIGGGELDAPEMAIRIDGLQFAELRHIRITHRYEEHFIPDSQCWPKQALRIGGPTEGTVTTDIIVNILHRLALTVTENTQSKLGSFSNFSDDYSVARMTIKHHVNPSVRGVSVPPKPFKKGIHPSSAGNRIFLNGRTIEDSRVKNVLRAHATSGYVGSDGFLTEISKIRYDAANIDDGDNFNNERSEFVAPYSGYFHVSVQIFLSLPSEGSVRLAIMAHRGESSIVVAQTATTAAAGLNSFQVECRDLFQEGDGLWISAQQMSEEKDIKLKSGGPYLNRFEVTAL